MSDINRKMGGEPEISEESIWDDSRSFAVQKRILPDGRSFMAELWGEDGYTFLTYSFSVHGLENLPIEQVVSYLESQGISIDLNKFPLEKIQLITNFNNSDQYDLTLTIGESDE